MEELALLRAYEPVVRYTHGELFLPTAVGPYVQRCSLWIHEPGTPPDTAELLVPPGELSLERLAALGRDRRDRSLELRFVEQRLRGAAMRAWRRADRPRLRGAARLASVGVLARTVDSLLRLSLLLRGLTPGGTAAAAEVAARACSAAPITGGWCATATTSCCSTGCSTCLTIGAPRSPV